MRLLDISGVFHKACGEVNEEGTVAPASTVITVPLSSPSGNHLPLPRCSRADPPFIFYIRDTRSGSILFLERLAEPG